MTGVSGPCRVGCWAISLLPGFGGTKANALGAALWHGGGTEKGAGVGWDQGNHHTVWAGGVGRLGCRDRDGQAGQGQSANQPIFCCAAAAGLVPPLGLVLHLCALAARVTFPFMVRHILTRVC